MDKDVLALIVWVGSAASAVPIIWLKQRRYLGDQQVAACLLSGPIALVVAILCPRSWFTSREEAEGRPQLTTHQNLPTREGGGILNPRGREAAISPVSYADWPPRETENNDG